MITWFKRIAMILLVAAVGAYVVSIEARLRVSEQDVEDLEDATSVSNGGWGNSIGENVSQLIDDLESVQSEDYEFYMMEFDSRITDLEGYAHYH